MTSPEPEQIPLPYVTTEKLIELASELVKVAIAKTNKPVEAVIAIRLAAYMIEGSTITKVIDDRKASN